ncbi:MAG: flavodoxin [Schwartzia sp.]|nr:flavodoxin [Schwartzia sp. (in: firmicutes)]
MAVMALFLLTACGSDVGETSGSGEKEQAAAASAEAAPTSEKTGKKKILVAFFSRTGENYEVGNIAKGNTHIVAEMIAEATGAEMFEIKTVKPYPKDYRECTEVAGKEREENARPELVGKIRNMADYDTVFLGYPIWWSDLPMPVYTFLESYDWSGKTIIPFSTSAGDVLTGKENELPNFAKGATIREGIGIRGKRAQEQPDSVRQEVLKWLDSLGFTKSQ